MKTPVKILIITAVIAGAAGTVAVKKSMSAGAANVTRTAVAADDAEEITISGIEAFGDAKLPALIDFGGGVCTPCKMMTPVLKELKKDCAGRMNVGLIDIKKNPAADQKYHIDMIPTQIFFDATGRELFRHTGFFGKDDILVKCKELGFDLTAR